MPSVHHLQLIIFYAQINGTFNQKFYIDPNNNNKKCWKRIFVVCVCVCVYIWIRCSRQSNRIRSLRFAWFLRFFFSFSTHFDYQLHFNASVQLLCKHNVNSLTRFDHNYCLSTKNRIEKFSLVVVAPYRQLHCQYFVFFCCCCCTFYRLAIFINKYWKLA